MKKKKKKKQIIIINLKKKTKKIVTRAGLGIIAILTVLGTAFVSYATGYEKGYDDGWWHGRSF